ncbi:mitochondrial 54S ribosomal protein uL30m [Lipomyces chichibuensis]|uniref:mitochondrial 54S ribosomal protein uL30m n=1 Tax=Lipomyces chichibuensis TaxID=1546026 RepID=UPI0033441A89
MSYFRVQLHRSAIGLNKKTNEILRTLGLRKRGSVVYHNITAPTAGKILAVKELVRVRLVDKKLTKQEHNLTMKSNPGYYVIKEENH